MSGEGSILPKGSGSGRGRGVAGRVAPLARWACAGAGWAAAPSEGVLVWCISREPLCGVGGPLDVDVGGPVVVGRVIFEVALLGVPASVTIL